MSLKRIQAFLSHDELDPNAVDKKNAASGESRRCAAPQSLFALLTFLESCETVTVEIFVLVSRHFTVCSLLFLCSRALVQSHCLTCALSLYVINALETPSAAFCPVGREATPMETHVTVFLHRVYSRSRQREIHVGQRRFSCSAQVRVAQPGRLSLHMPGEFVLATP